MSAPAAPDCVILVDSNDCEVGSELKMPAHEAGLLHRAFSVFAFNTKGETMLQRRALEKYHSGGLWTNTCCSHPRPGESTDAAAHRRLREEMGFDCALTHAFGFIYRAELDHGLIEHEFDHVFTGTFAGEPALNLAEACEWRWASPTDVDREMADAPERFTVWFRIAWAELGRRKLLEASAG